MILVSVVVTDQTFMNNKAYCYGTVSFSKITIYTRTIKIRGEAIDILSTTTNDIVDLTVYYRN